MGKNQQTDVQRKIQDLLESAEKERAQKRVAYALAELERGKVEYLLNGELLVFLPTYIKDLGESGSDAQLVTMLNVFEKATLSDEVKIRERAIATLSIAVSLVIEKGSDEQVARISEILVGWMNRETELLQGYETVALQLEQLSILLMRFKRWDGARGLVECASKITCGTNKKSRLIVRVAARIQERVADKDSIRELLKELGQLTDPDSSTAAEMKGLLLAMGTPFVRIALEMLQEVHQEERELIVELLVESGETAIHEIERILDSGHAPVRLTCDLVRILSRMKRESLYPRLAACLRHPVSEVQHEVVRGIIQNGLHVVPRLLEALRLVDDELKVLVIKKLSQISDKEINTRLLTMLSEYTDSMRIRNRQVVNALVVALGKQVRQENLATLKALQSGLQFEADSILAGLLEESISRLELAQRKVEHRVVDEGGVEFSNDPVQLEQAKVAIAEVQKKVEKLTTLGKTDQALQLLKSRIREYALAGKQPAAEALRDLILKIDHGAIEVLLEVEDFLVEQKTGSFDHNLQLWQELRSRLGEHVLQKMLELSVEERYGTGDIIFAQRERNENLYFLASGTVSLHCGSGTSEVFLKKLKAGSIFGAETIFEVSLSSVTIKAQSRVRVYSLSVDSLDILNENCPGSYEAMRDYCKGQIDIPELLKISGTDRRNLVRRSVSKNVETKILDMYGVVGQRSLVGRLQNISYGGICYEIGIENAKGVRRLLGRQMQVIFTLRDRQRVECNGKFVAFERNVAEEGKYFVHVRIADPIDPEVFELIVKDSV